jgi:hypothetical protein
MFGIKKVMCAKCMKERMFKASYNRSGGSRCEAGHLICIRCSRKSLLSRLINPLWWLKSIFLFWMKDYRKLCPICEAKLSGIKKDQLPTY